MKNFAIVLAIVASMAAPGITELRGYMELRHNINGFPFIGQLRFFGDYPVLRTDLHMDGSNLEGDKYIGYVHEDNHFPGNCNETGRTYNIYRNVPFNPINITVDPQHEVAPFVYINTYATLQKNDRYSIMDRPIVFYENSVADMDRTDENSFQAALRGKGIFCGYV